jgi:uncharacterized membrane protein
MQLQFRHRVPIESQLLRSRTPMTELDETKSQEAVLRTVSIEVSGPIPSPQVLRQYDGIVPDGANRIVRLAEDQIHHRQSMEARGQVFTFALALTTLVGGVITVSLGYSPEGLVPLVAAIAGLGGLFVYREWRAHRGVASLENRDSR